MFWWRKLACAMVFVAVNVCFICKCNPDNQQKFADTISTEKFVSLPEFMYYCIQYRITLMVQGVMRIYRLL